MKNKTILVTAIGSFSAEAVIKGCKAEGMRVIGCDVYPAAWVVNSREVDRFYQAPYATERKVYRDFLTEVCRKEAVDYLLPLTDAEIDVLNEWRAEGSAPAVQLAEGGMEAPEAGAAEAKFPAVLCLSDCETIRLCRDKQAMEAFLKEQGFACGIPGQSLASVIAEEEDTGYELLSYPLVLKPRDGRSSQGLVMIEHPEAMQAAAEHFREQEQRYLVQPKLPGRVVTVDVIRQPERGFCFALGRRELLRTLNGAGTSVQIFRSEELEKLCCRIAEALDIRGCVNFEFIEGSCWHFLECNPRFSGGVAFSCKAGYDMVRNHLRCFTGDEVEAPGEIGEQYIARRYTEYRMDDCEA